MDEPRTTGNPVLEKALDLYRGIEKDFFEAIAATGVVFADEDSERKHSRQLISRLADIGARVRNGGASVVLGALSRGCVACTGSCPSRTFSITNNCHRDCYFCFNPNQRDFAYYCEHDFPWRRQLDDLAAEKGTPDCIALSGGEPMLKPNEVFAFFQKARQLFPATHLRMYTSGDLLDEAKLKKLRDAGMDEVRFSVKTDDPADLREKVLGIMAMATRYIPTVMVEMPVIPGTEELMKDLLRRLDGMGAFGINLLEFTYPMWNWEAFDSRDFTLRNPPFNVVYDYTYAGSLAVEGSEELALRLMLWAHEDGLHLGMHYCSLENKHRGQIRKLNEPYAGINPNYAFDYDDFFLKTITVYGKDCNPVRNALARLGCRNTIFDKESQTLCFHPKWLRLLNVKRDDGSPVEYCVSYNVIAKQGGTINLRELKVCRAQDVAPVALADLTARSDTAAGCAIL